MADWLHRIFGFGEHRWGEWFEADYEPTLSRALGLIPYVYEYKVCQSCNKWERGMMVSEGIRIEDA